MIKSCVLRLPGRFSTPPRPRESSLLVTTGLVEPGLILYSIHDTCVGSGPVTTLTIHTALKLIYGQVPLQIYNLYIDLLEKFERVCKVSDDIPYQNAPQYCDNLVILPRTLKL